MIEELTMTQIAARIGCSERTAQRWIVASKLKATALQNHKYAVDSADILALALPDHLSHELAERLERLEGQIEELRATVEQLQAQVELQAQLQRTARPSSRPANQESRPHVVSSAEGNTLPDGLVSARGFGTRHGIAESTVKKAIQTGRIPAILGRWKLGRAWVQEALDLEGRSVFVMSYHNNPHFTRCDDPECPCHGV